MLSGLSSPPFGRAITQLPNRHIMPYLRLIINSCHRHPERLLRHPERSRRIYDEAKDYFQKPLLPMEMDALGHAPWRTKNFFSARPFT
jgi:hypothetical protein